MKTLIWLVAAVSLVLAAPVARAQDKPDTPPLPTPTEPPSPTAPVPDTTNAPPPATDKGGAPEVVPPSTQPPTEQGRSGASGVGNLPHRDGGM